MKIILENWEIAFRTLFLDLSKYSQLTLVQLLIKDTKDLWLEVEEIEKWLQTLIKILVKGIKLLLRLILKGTRWFLA